MDYCISFCKLIICGRVLHVTAAAMVSMVLTRHVLLRVCIESPLAAWSAEIIRRAFIIGLPLRRALVHFHIAYRIYCHAFSPPFVINTLRTGVICPRILLLFWRTSSIPI